jgi:hypothetical protein
MPASQAGRRGFESHRPLLKKVLLPRVCKTSTRHRQGGRGSCHHGRRDLTFNGTPIQDRWVPRSGMTIDAYTRSRTKRTFIEKNGFCGDKGLFTEFLKVLDNEGVTSFCRGQTMIRLVRRCRTDRGGEAAGRYLPPVGGLDGFWFPTLLWCRLSQRSRIAGQKKGQGILQRDRFNECPVCKRVEWQVYCLPFSLHFFPESLSTKPHVFRLVRACRRFVRATEDTHVWCPPARRTNAQEISNES